MDLIYYGPLFRSRTRKVLYGQILKGDWVPLTNKMSGKIDKRPYRNFSQAIILVITLMLKHALLRLMQKYLSPVINCFLCGMNWYSWGVIRSFHRKIRTRSHRIRIVVKFYNHTLRLRHECIPMRYYSPLVLF